MGIELPEYAGDGPIVELSQGIATDKVNGEEGQHAGNAGRDVGEVSSPNFA